MNQTPAGQEYNRTRRFRRSLPWLWRRRFECVCCGAFALEEVHAYEICRECGWEDCLEGERAPDQEIRPNYLSLNSARQVVGTFGAAACSHVNRARGLTIGELERMSPAELANLKSVHA